MRLAQATSETKNLAQQDVVENGQRKRKAKAATCGVCLKQDADVKDACLGIVQDRQTVPRSELMSFVVLAENINAAGLFHGCGWQERNEESTFGDVSSRHGTVSRNAASLFRVSGEATAKELDIGSTVFDMRRNTFADEMAGRPRVVQVLPSQA